MHGLDRTIGKVLRLEDRIGASSGSHGQRHGGPDRPRQWVHRHPAVTALLLGVPLTIVAFLNLPWPFTGLTLVLTAVLYVGLRRDLRHLERAKERARREAGEGVPDG